jgi:hypothetical protein
MRPTQNLLIEGAGATIGVALAVSLILYMVNAFAMRRFNTSSIVVLVLGQVSALWPVLEPASIPPPLAMRAA